jgi:hypothetical protein
VSVSSLSRHPTRRICLVSVNQSGFSNILNFLLGWLYFNLFFQKINSKTLIGFRFVHEEKEKRSLSGDNKKKNKELGRRKITERLIEYINFKGFFR